MKLLHLYVGQKRPFGKAGEFSGIDKKPVDNAEVDENGITTDVQVDKRFHGGPEKALHQYSITAYEKLAKQYPLMHKKIKLGSIGENLIAEDMHDANVHVGDIYQMGALKVQVSAPRIPCWKLNEIMQLPKADRFVASKGYSGWYYRVLEGGSLAVGDDIELLKRQAASMSVQHLMQVYDGARTDLDEMKQACELVGLDPEWKERLERRYLVRKESEEEKATADYDV